MEYLTAEQVLFLHSRLVDETGGTHGVRDLGLLESALARPKATFDAQDLYPDVLAQAAALMESIVLNHPFVDGNKRTGIAATGLFLQRSGRRLTATSEDLEGFALQVAESKLTRDEIAGWLAAHSETAPGE